MELSPYNKLIDADDGRTFAYNNVSGTLLLVNPNVRAFLHDRTGQLSVRELHALMRGRFLIGDATQEQKYVAAKLAEMRYSSGSLQYTLVLTYACNLKCPYCYEDALRSRRNHMTRETAELVVSTIRDDIARTRASRLGITLYGGEPVLNLRTGIFVFEELDKICRPNGIAISGCMISNGTLITRERAVELRPYVQTVQLTLDGGPGQHDRTRISASGKSTFWRILESAQLLLDLGMRVIFRIQVTPDNPDSVRSALDALKARGLLGHQRVSFYVFPILDIGGVCSSRSFECSHRYYNPDLFQAIWRIGEEYGIRLWQAPLPAWQRPFCSFVHQGAWIIDPSGDKYKCVSLVGKREAAVGSVYPERDPLVRSRREGAEAAFVNRSGSTIDRCGKCEYLPGCDGGCAYLAQLETGDMQQPSCDTYGQVVRAQLGQLCRQTLASSQVSR